LKIASDTLAVGESELRKAEQAERDAEKRASESREKRARADAVSEASVIQVATASDRIREDLNIDPEKLLETLDVDPEKIPLADRIEADVLRLRRQRDALGAVIFELKKTQKKLMKKEIP